MQNNITLPAGKLAGLSPISVGLIVGGILLFAVVAVVRLTLAPTSDIGQATAAGAAAVQLPVQSNVSAALPAFSLQSANTTAADAPAWLEVHTTEHFTVVWADWWFNCRYVAVGGFNYAVGADYAVTGWPGDEQFQALPAITRRDIGELCHGQ